MSSEFLIRNLRLSDLCAVRELDRKVYGTFAYPPYVIRQLIDICSPLCYVAVRDATLSGYAIGALAVDTNLGWILSVAVDEAHRRLGVAADLTTRVLSEFRARRCTAARLTVDPGNTAATQLYGRLGFVTVDYDSDYFGPSVPRATMEFVLKDMSYD
jgi:ribosomal protein S18 acetylase RimI-like enzyme